MARPRNRPGTREANRFAVRYKPTKTRGKGNYAVVSRNTGRIKSRHATREAARQSAGIRGRAVRRTRARRR